MQLPDPERVIYGENPLQGVICQLRFPSILRIASELPTAYQEKIRRQYPLYSEKHEIQSELLQQVPQSISKQLPPQIFELLAATTSKRSYEFTTEDNFWTITLASDSLALTSHRYQRWEDFRNHLQGPLEALSDIYTPPAFFSRIGLRYQNVIQRSGDELKNAPWSELLQPYIAGVLAAPEVNEDAIDNVMQRVEIRLDSYNSRVRIVHGLVELVENGESCYLIDNDFFTEQRTETSDALSRLDYFNQQSRRLFRWSITDKLHEAMVPQRI
jgi:uncharacterized protein (TIGR04255 family)